MKLDDCISFRLARASRALYHPYKDRLHRYHLKPPQLFLLLTLYDHDGVAAGELASRVHLDKSTLTGMLKRLEERGLLTREEDENDGRSVRVALTERGRRLRRPLLAIYQDVNQRVSDALNGHEPALLSILEDLEHAAASV